MRILRNNISTEIRGWNWKITQLKLKKKVVGEIY